jgi:ADP-dependent NAD(P)H-hydrate dehydratase
MSGEQDALETVVNLPELAPRPADTNKGTYGTVLVVAGSQGMSGAAILCGSAALRGGAGLVRVATPEAVLPIVAGGNPCFTSIGLHSDPSGKLAAGEGTTRGRILEAVQGVDVVAMGPGLGRGDEISALLADLVEQISAPLVLDADGLNAFAGRAERLGKHAGPLIITPHPGEFARLLKMETKAVLGRRAELAVQFAREQKCVVVLNGHGTIVTDGRRIYRSITGNPGMATGGTGDVLTGLVAALAGQGLEPFAAAQLGVHVHGLAGDLAAREVGEVSLIATDLLDYLPRAFRQL